MVHVNTKLKPLKVDGERLRELRESKGWTTTELAWITNINYQSIIGIEKGRTKTPTVTTIAVICRALDISIEEILVDDVDEEENSR